MTMDDATLEKPPVEQDSQDFKCPSCGGHQVFDPVSSQLRCEQCHSAVEVPPIEQKTVIEYDFAALEQRDGRDFYQKSRITRCDSCGAQVELTDYVIATRCVFCGSSQVAEVDTVPAIPPAAVVPFAVNAIQASAAFKKWLGRRIFAPAAVHQEYLPDHFQGVYLPYWTYDSQTATQYQGMAGEHYYVTETYRAVENGRSVMRSRQVQRTRWFPVSGTYEEAFDDVLVQGGSSLDNKILNRLEPFDLRAAKPYQIDFLAGFRANSYSVSVREGYAVAQTIMDKAIEAGIRNQVHADELRLTQKETRHHDLKCKLLLLPVWASSFRYRGKIYQFLVNGQTGRVQGQTPISALRVTLAIILGVLAAAGIYQLVALMTGS